MYYITLLLALTLNNGDEVFKYIQHKESYLSYSECTYYLNAEPMVQYIHSSIDKHLCDKYNGYPPPYTIREYACMTKSTYEEYNEKYTLSDRDTD